MDGGALELCDEAGRKAGIGAPRRVGVRLASSARWALVRRCRGSRRVAGACRYRARRPLRCGGGGSSGTRTRLRRRWGRRKPWPSAQRFRFENTRWIASTRWAGVLGRWSWSDRPRPAIGDHPRARRLPATRHCARRNPRSASRMRRGSPSGVSDRASAHLALRAAALPTGGRLLLRAQRMASSISAQAGCDRGRPWHGAACAAGARHSCS